MPEDYTRLDASPGVPRKTILAVALGVCAVAGVVAAIVAVTHNSENAPSTAAPNANGTTPSPISPPPAPATPAPSPGNAGTPSPTPNASTPSPTPPAVTDAGVMYLSRHGDKGDDPTNTLLAWELSSTTPIPGILTGTEGQPLSEPRGMVVDEETGELFAVYAGGSGAGNAGDSCVAVFAKYNETSKSVAAQFIPSHGTSNESTEPIPAWMPSRFPC